MHQALSFLAFFFPFCVQTILLLDVAALDKAKVLICLLLFLPLQILQHRFSFLLDFYFLSTATYMLIGL